LAQKQYNPYTIIEHYVLRATLLPFDFHKNTLSKDHLSVTDLLQILKNSILIESIYLALAKLYAQVLIWEQGTLTYSKKSERLQRAILKYFTRITTRCTPFGLFAFCSTLTLNNQNAYHRYTIPNRTSLTQLSQEHRRDKAKPSQVLCVPNTSLYSINDHYRHIEYRIVIDNKRRMCSLESIIEAKAIQVIINRASPLYYRAIYRRPVPIPTYFSLGRKVDRSVSAHRKRTAGFFESHTKSIQKRVSSKKTSQQAVEFKIQESEATIVCRTHAENFVPD
jgi:hypothetical protein